MFGTLKPGFIGGGNMVAALIGGLIAKDAHGANTVMVDPTEPARSRAKQTWSARIIATSDAELTGHDMIALVVKSQQIREVCAQLIPYLRDNLVLPVVAGIRI